jgi:GNAT superfamily N-acetyltransferase
MNLRFAPLTPATWDAFETLFGAKGVCCALAPRGDYPALARSRVMRPIDDRPVWSVSCLFVHRGWRGQGVTTALLQAASRFPRKRGAELLEGYPVDPAGKRLPAAFAWTGLPASFERAGFREVARGSPTRPIMRKKLGSE